jgi:hypothetical protein
MEERRQDKDLWQDFVNAAMNIRFPQDEWNFFIG